MSDESTDERCAPLGVCLQEEMDARGWDVYDVATRMGPPQDAGKNLLIIQMILAIHDKRMICDVATARSLASAFDVSAQFFLNLDAAHRGVEPLQAAP